MTDPNEEIDWAFSDEFWRKKAIEQERNEDTFERASQMRKYDDEMAKHQRLLARKKKYGKSKWEI
jgi:hypothetical protein